MRQPFMTGAAAGALTVAGQWRSFTAFPSILAIAVVNCAAHREDSRECHGSEFHDINIYSGAVPCKSKREAGRERTLWAAAVHARLVRALPADHDDLRFAGPQTQPHHWMPSATAGWQGGNRPRLRVPDFHSAPCAHQRHGAVARLRALVKEKVNIGVLPSGLHPHPGCAGRVHLHRGRNDRRAGGAKHAFGSDLRRGRTLSAAPPLAA